jgi:hypothetical protein
LQVKKGAAAAKKAGGFTLPEFKLPFGNKE